MSDPDWIEPAPADWLPPAPKKPWPLAPVTEPVTEIVAPASPPPAEFPSAVLWFPVYCPNPLCRSSECVVTATARGRRVRYQRCRRCGLRFKSVEAPAPVPRR